MTNGKRSKRGFKTPASELEPGIVRPEKLKPPTHPKPKVKRPKGAKPEDFRAKRELRQMTRSEEKPASGKRAYKFAIAVHEPTRCQFRVKGERCENESTMWVRGKHLCGKPTCLKYVGV